MFRTLPDCAMQAGIKACLPADRDCAIPHMRECHKKYCWYHNSKELYIRAQQKPHSYSTAWSIKISFSQKTVVFFATISFT
jgi:hypothetical protein